jgi:hypothetical protein
MLKSKFDRNVDEFCDYGNLEKYRDLLIDIFSKIEIAGCRISTRQDKPLNIHSKTENGNCLIQIYADPKFNQCFYQDPIEIVWIILHEFGHHQIGVIDKKDVNNPEIRNFHEKKAWEYARTEVLKYQMLSDRITEFDYYCIESLKKNNYE